MNISKLINDHGKKHRPYMRGLVNHLPMTQLALYKMSGDLEMVKKYTETYVERAKIDLVKPDFQEVNSIEECLGNRDLYEGCLVLIRKKIEEENIEQVIHDVLNTYPLGMSSGLFHTLIRVAYAVEGYEVENELAEEVARALAYYITAYREAKVFNREINGLEAIEEIERIINNPHITQVRESKGTMGQRLRALYNDEEYLKEGFVIEGTEDEKIRALLNFILPAYINSGDIVILHCITGLHALIVLKEYYDDFNNALDILTSCIITHLLALDELDFNNGRDRIVGFSWGNIKSMGIESPDVHTIKLTYSCSELAKTYEKLELKLAAKKRIIKQNSK